MLEQPVEDSQEQERPMPMPADGDQAGAWEGYCLDVLHAVHEG